MIVLHVWIDGEEVYATEEALLKSVAASTGDAIYVGWVRSALSYAHMRQGARAYIDPNSSEGEYVVVFPKLEGEGAIVMLGNLFEGYTFHGPFEDFDAAAAWAEGQDSESVVCTLRNVNEEETT